MSFSFQSRRRIWFCPQNRSSQPFQSKIRRMERPNPEQMTIPWEALSREKQKLQLLVEKSPFAVAIIDREGNYTYVNPKFTELFGYTLEDIPTGRDWFEKAYTDPKRRKEALTAWFEDLRTYPIGEIRPRAFPVTCKDGSEKLILFRTVTTEQERSLCNLRGHHGAKESRRDTTRERREVQGHSWRISRKDITK